MIDLNRGTMGANDVGRAASLWTFLGEAAALDSAEKREYFIRPCGEIFHGPDNSEPLHPWTEARKRKEPIGGGMLWKQWNRFVDSLAALILLLMAGTVALQIFYRYILNQPLFWPYETSLFFFVWLIWIGGATGMRDERQIRVDFFEQFFPARVRSGVAIFNSLLSIAFMILVVYYGIKVTAVQASAEYDALPFHRDYLFAVAPIVGSLMIVYLTVVLIRQIRRMAGSRNQP